MELKGKTGLMGFRKILLFNALYGVDYYDLASPPAGLGTIAEILEAEAVPYHVMDMNLHGHISKALRFAGEVSPDLVGISMMTLNYRENYRFMGALKKILPGIKIVVGGPHVSTYRERIFTDCPDVDFAVLEEGEETFRELAAGRPPEKIPGLIFRKGGEAVFTGKRPFLKDLDRLPFPRYRKFDLDRYYSGEIPLITSRGCPYQCTFCTVATAMGRKFRMRSPEHILEEIRYWYDRERTKFCVQDDNFTLNAQRLYALYARLKHQGLLGKIRFSLPNGIRADQASRKVLLLLKRMGVTHLGIGVEAGNDRILKTLKKNESIKIIERAIKNAVELGFHTALFFLIGAPGETVSDVEDSFHLAERYPVNLVNFYNIIPYPGTEIYDWVAANDLFLRRPEDYLNDANPFLGEPCFSTKELSAHDRRRLYKKAMKVKMRVHRRNIARRLSHLPVAGYLMSRVITIPGIWNVYFHHPACKAFLNRVKTAVHY